VARVGLSARTPTAGGAIDSIIGTLTRSNQYPYLQKSVLCPAEISTLPRRNQYPAPAPHKSIPSVTCRSASTVGGAIDSIALSASGGRMSASHSAPRQRNLAPHTTVDRIRKTPHTNTTHDVAKHARMQNDCKPYNTQHTTPDVHSAARAQQERPRRSRHATKQHRVGCRCSDQLARRAFAK
jgi:hypothetical protein